MMEKFAYLRLPLVPRKLVVRMMDPGELLTFSVLSRRCRRMVQKTKTPGKYIQLTYVTPGKIEIILACEGKFEKLHAVLETFRDTIFDDCINTIISWRPEKYEVLSLHGVEVSKCYESDGRVSLYGRELGNPQIHRALAGFFEILCNVFPFPKLRLHCNNVPTATVSFLAASFDRAFSSLSITNNERFSNVNAIFNLRQVLESFTADRFELDWFIDFHNYRYSGGLRYPKMKIQNAHWLTMESVLKMNCIILQALNVTFTRNNLITFIRRWQDGGFKNLETVYFNHRMQGENWTTLLQGQVPTQPWNPKLRPRKHGSRRCENGRDIKRDDGMLATIMLEKDSFGFCVWQPKYYSRDQE